MSAPNNKRSSSTDKKKKATQQPPSPPPPPGQEVTPAASSGSSGRNNSSASPLLPKGSTAPSHWNPINNDQSRQQQATTGDTMHNKKTKSTKSAKLSQQSPQEMKRAVKYQYGRGKTTSPARTRSPRSPYATTLPGFVENNPTPRTATAEGDDDKEEDNDKNNTRDSPINNEENHHAIPDHNGTDLFGSGAGSGGGQTEGGDVHSGPGSQSGYKQFHASSSSGHSQITAENSDVSSIGLGWNPKAKRKSGFCVDVAPYFLSSGIAMTIPIVFIIVLSAITLNRSIHDLEIIESTHSFLLEIPRCTEKMMDERDLAGKWISTGSNASKQALDEARHQVDSCRQRLLYMLSKLSHGRPESFEGPMLSAAPESADLALVRASVDVRNSSGIAERRRISEMINHYTDIVLVIDDLFWDPSKILSRLHSLLTLTAHASWCRGVGDEIAFASGKPDPEIREEYLRSYAHLDAAFRDASNVPGFEEEMALPEVSAMLYFAALMDETTGYLQIQANPDDWWTVMSKGVHEISEFFVRQQETFGTEEIDAHLRDELIKLFIGIFVCVFAAGLLAAHQARMRNRMMRQIDALHDAKKAVSAFVPRSFLATMGYTSITQVQAGNCTETALTMLFADIRGFTTVAEGMGNTELFDWVQAYFERMTGVIERGKGHINQFIGDALFAVFKHSRDACFTGVEMHSSVEQLNIVNRCKRNAERSEPVEIGVGIHQDCVALGVMGDETRHTCTLVSSSVNLASRLEGLTKVLRCRMILSSAAVEALTEDELDEIRMRCLGPTTIKDNGKTIELYELFMSDPEGLQNYKFAYKEQFEELVAEFTAAATTALDPELQEKLKQAASEQEEQRERLSAQSSVRQNSVIPPDSPEKGKLSRSDLLSNASHKNSGINEQPQSPGLTFPIYGGSGGSAAEREVKSPNQRPSSAKPEVATEALSGPVSNANSYDGDDDEHDMADEADKGRARDLISYHQIVDEFLSATSSNPRIRQLVRALVEGQKEHQVTDETFYRLLIFHKGKTGLVFGTK